MKMNILIVNVYAKDATVCKKFYDIIGTTKIFKDKHKTKGRFGVTP